MIENRSYQTHNRNAILAITCSAMLHWLAAQCVGIALSDSQRPAMGLPHAAIKAIISLPESALADPKVVSEDISHKTSTTGNVDKPQIGSEIERIPGPANLLTNQIKYFSSTEVDVAATPVFTPPLLFPERAFISRLSGKVRVRLFINEDGKVASAEVIETIPPHQPFADSAVATVQNTIFSPALIQGRKVKSQKVIEVMFNAEEDKPKD